MARRGLAQESAISLALVAQLEQIGGMSHWAVYAAAHLSDPGQREEAVLSLLWRHAPEWSADPSAHSFLLERVKVPAALLAEAMAGWLGYVGQDVEGATPIPLPWHDSSSNQLFPCSSLYRLCVPSVPMHAGQLQLLMKANKWTAAHKVWADTMAVDTMASASTAALPMAGYLAAFEAHSADITDTVSDDHFKSWRFFHSLAILQVIYFL